MWNDHFCFENWDKQTIRQEIILFIYFEILIDRENEIKTNSFLMKKAILKFRRRGLMRENNWVEQHWKNTILIRQNAIDRE